MLSCLIKPPLTSRHLFQPRKVSRKISNLQPIDEFKNKFSNCIKHSKDTHFSDEFLSKVTPYNSKFSPFKQPSLYMETQSIETIKQIIKLANQTNSTIIPMGGNTNLVRLNSFELAESTEIPLIIFLKYTAKNLTFCNKSNEITCSPSITMEEVHTTLQQIGRRWNVDFSARNATIGGIVSTNAGGQNKKANESISTYTLLGSDLNIHTLKSKSTNTSSMMPIGSKNNLLASQGLCGIITEINIKTEKDWQTSYSSFIKVPLPLTYDIIKILKTTSNQTLVACELIDYNCLKANPNNQINLDSENEMILLCQFATHEKTLNHDQMWETIYNKYPEIAETVTISHSQKQESEFWHFRHHISDNNRNWAKQHHMTYIGYDIALPKETFSEILPHLREQLATKKATLFCFGHSMQSTQSFTLHINVAFSSKSNLTQQNISDVLIKTLQNKNASFAAEHGGMGHKSLPDTLAITSKDQLKETLTLMNTYDPQQTFKKDIKKQLIKYIQK